MNSRLRAYEFPRADGRTGQTSADQALDRCILKQGGNPCPALAAAGSATFGVRCSGEAGIGGEPILDLGTAVRTREEVAEFNTERPNQALGQKPPCAFYTPSRRTYEGLPELDYPFHDMSVVVTACGRICFKTRKINLSQVFAGQRVGIKQVEDRLWLVSFMDYDLGYFDDKECRLEPIDNPFGAKLLPMSPE